MVIKRKQLFDTLKKIGDENFIESFFEFAPFTGKLFPIPTCNLQEQMFS